MSSPKLWMEIDEKKSKDEKVERKPDKGSVLQSKLKKKKSQKRTHQNYNKTTEKPARRVICGLAEQKLYN